MVYKMLKYFVLPPTDLMWAKMNWRTQPMQIGCWWSIMGVKMKDEAWITSIPVYLGMGCNDKDLVSTWDPQFWSNNIKTQFQHARYRLKILIWVLRSWSTLVLVWSLEFIGFLMRLETTAAAVLNPKGVEDWNFCFGCQAVMLTWMQMFSACFKIAM